MYDCKQETQAPESFYPTSPDGNTHAGGDCGDLGLMQQSAERVVVPGTKPTVIVREAFRVNLLRIQGGALVVSMMPRSLWGPRQLECKKGFSLLLCFQVASNIHERRHWLGQHQKAEN